jgi:extracellular factor (EF) 3-hydroxypalmitic acid methyl ester biosynthesis protein
MARDRSPTPTAQSLLDESELALPLDEPLLDYRQPENRGREYSDLDGGQGREVNFRPHRYRSSDFGPVDPVARLIIGGTTHACRLVDVSQNGVAFECPAGLTLELGTIIEQLVVSFDDLEAYRGAARVSSIRCQDDLTIVGAFFVDSLMSIADVLQLRDIKAWRSQEMHALGLAESNWHVPGHEKFKALVSELRLFFEDAHEQLRELEALLPWHVLHGEGESVARAALIGRIREQFVPDLVRYTEQIDAAMRFASPEQVQPLKEFSIRNLHKYFMQAPVGYRARHKPLGYPGDYVVMRYFYERHFEGPTLFAKTVNLACASCKGSLAVQSRKNLIKQRLRQLVDTEGTKRTLRILSVAAGPAQEVFELLSELDHVASPLEIVLFDQDEEALTYAYSRLKPIAQSRFPDTVKVTYVYDAIKHLLLDPTVFMPFGRFDAIFSCGLFDYLQFPTAVSLCRNLATNLAPGAIAYIGNMVPSNPTRWLMEHHLDWYLVYRTHEQMLEFATKAVPGARIQVLEEETGVNPFVEITRI